MHTHYDWTHSTLLTSQYLGVLQVETLHDFEAAKSDELELKKGDIVLVIPTALAEDQVRIIWVEKSVTLLV